MRLQCPAKSLLAAVRQCQPATAKRTTRPVLACVRIDCDIDRRLTVSATDLECSVRATVVNFDDANASPGAVVVSPERLSPILAEAGNQTVQLHATDDRGIVVRVGKSRFELPGYDVDEFPEVTPFDTSTPHLELTAATLRLLISRTEFAAERKESPRYAYHGLLIEKKSDEPFRIVSTDTKRLAIADGVGCSGQVECPFQIVPPTLLRLVARMDTADSDTVRLAIRKNEVAMSSGTVDISTRVLEGKFPPYRDVLPKKHAVKLSLPVEEFAASVRQASITTETETRRVDFDFSPGTLTLTASGADVGACEVQMDLPEFDGPSFQIAFDPVYLTEMLRTIDCETVSVELSNANRPAVFRVDNFTYLIMPMAN